MSVKYDSPEYHKLIAEGWIESWRGIPRLVGLREMWSRLEDPARFAQPKPEPEPSNAR